MIFPVLFLLVTRNTKSWHLKLVRHNKKTFSQKTDFQHDKIRHFNALSTVMLIETSKLEICFKSFVKTARCTLSKKCVIKCESKFYPT